MFFPHFGFAGVGIFGQQSFGSQDHRRGGITGLNCAGANERLLDRVEIDALGQPLDGFDSTPIDLGGQSRKTGTRIRCAELEIGRNSVSPCINASTIICRISITVPPIPKRRLFYRYSGKILNPALNNCHFERQREIPSVKMTLANRLVQDSRPETETEWIIQSPLFLRMWKFGTYMII